MKTGNYRMLVCATVFASLLCLVSFAWVLAQSYFICSGSGEGCIVWCDALLPLQICVFTGRLLFKSAFYLLLIVFLVKQHVAIKNGSLFPGAKVGIMYATAACFLIGETCYDNFSTALILETPRCGAFVVNGDTLIYATMLLAFALIYKVAVKVSEENNLTI